MQKKKNFAVITGLLIFKNLTQLAALVTVCPLCYASSFGVHKIVNPLKRNITLYTFTRLYSHYETKK
jgi:hypothetical protein